VEASDDPPALTYGVPLRGASGVAILIHGRGRDAAEMRGVAAQLATQNVHFIMPAVAGGAWYPKSFLEPIENNEPALSRSLARYGGWIDGLLAQGTPSSRIVLCGFSQGACLTAEFVARHPRRYGAVVLFTGGVIGPLDERRPPAAGLDGTPVYLGASLQDSFVPERRARETADLFAAMGAEVTTRFYPGDSHEISASEMAEARGYFAAVDSAIG
jgi:predicted esterase